MGEMIIGGLLNVAGAFLGRPPASNTIISQTGGGAWAGGGGGSGGSVVLKAMDSVVNNGTVQAKGGNGSCAGRGGGGGGGGGRIFAQDVDGSIPGRSWDVSPGTVGTGNVAGVPGNPGATSTVGNISAYSLSGTYTSGAINTGQKSDFTTVTYSKTTNASTTVTIDIRAGNSATAPAWGTFNSDWPATASSTNITSGGSISALDGYQYVQYRANLSTTNAAYTPSLDDITVNYQYYPNLL